MENNNDNTQQRDEQSRITNESNEQWQQAGAFEDEEMDDRRFEIYDANEKERSVQFAASDNSDDEDEALNSGESEDNDDETTAEDWGDVDPQQSGNSGMDPSGPGSAV
ncbi:MAG TPA: hypothetical protein VFQ50_03775 [Flavobacterium sp.]|jgi:hypothetical protein|nr:hypothetical protein [Flavobacterium sp.]